MTSCWHWHRSANFGSTPFSVWSSASMRRIRWQERLDGYPSKFMWCSMIAFPISYPCWGFTASYYSHDPCFSCHAHAHLSYVPMLAFWVFQISGWPLCFETSRKLSPLISIRHKTISNYHWIHHLLLLLSMFPRALLFSYLSHHLHVSILCFKLIRNW